MLVLSRKSNEEIIIGSDIHVKVLEISGNRVRLGISAPNHVPVLRQEIFARMGANHEGEIELSYAESSAH